MALPKNFQYKRISLGNSPPDFEGFKVSKKAWVFPRTHLTPRCLPCDPRSALQCFGKTQAQMDTVLTKITFLHRCETSHASRHLHHHLDLKATGMMQIHQGLPDGEVDSDTCRSLQIIEVRWTLYLKTQRYSDLTYCIPSKMKIGWLKSPHQVVNPGFFMKRVNHSESCDIYQVLCGVFFFICWCKETKETLRLNSLGLLTHEPCEAFLQAGANQDLDASSGNCSRRPGYWAVLLGFCHHHCYHSSHLAEPNIPANLPLLWCLIIQ